MSNQDNPARCKICGGPIDGDRRRKICSSCRAKIAAQAAAPPSGKKIGTISHCAICGEEYAVTSAVQKYCKKCRKIVSGQQTLASVKRRSQSPPPGTTRTCAICGAEFSGNGTCKYCPSCREMLAAPKPRAGQVRAGETASCAICGAEYTAKNAVNIYCKKCAKIVASARAHACRERAAAKKAAAAQTPKDIDAMPPLHFSAAFRAAAATPDRAAYIVDAISSGLPGIDDPQQAANEMGRLWDAAHLSMADILAATGLSSAALADRHLLPRQSVWAWAHGETQCPDHLILLLAEAEGLYQRPSSPIKNQQKKDDEP